MDAWMLFGIESKIEKYMYFNRFLRFKDPKNIGDCIGILFGSFDTNVDPPPFLALQYL
jgi:hypothetical protein